MNKAKLRKLSIGLSVIAWIIFVALCLVPMSDGGLTVFACLVMMAFFTVIVILDILATRSLDKPKLGCLTVIYFVVWSIILCNSGIVMLTAPFQLQGEAAKDPWFIKMLYSFVFAIPTVFALAKILIGLALRRKRDEKVNLIQSIIILSDNITRLRKKYFW